MIQGRLLINPHLPPQGNSLGELVVDASDLVTAIWIGIQPKDVAVFSHGIGFGAKGSPAPHGEVGGLTAKGEVMNLGAEYSHSLPNQFGAKGALNKAGFAAHGND